MKTSFIYIVLLLFLTSCSRNILFLPLSTDHEATTSLPLDSLKIEIAQAHQTKKNIGFEVNLTNHSNQKIYVDPIDFYCTPEDFEYSIDPIDPDYLLFQINNPGAAIADAAYWHSESNGLDVSVTILSEVILNSDVGYVSMSGIRFLQYWSQVRDAKKVLIDGLLQPKSLNPGESLKGLVYFPKKEFKKIDATYINWERQGIRVHSTFLAK